MVLVFLILMTTPLSFGNNQPVTADDIIVQELVRTKIVNDRNHFLTVNITKDVTQSPIGISLVRLENKLPFMDSLDSGLEVSVMRITPQSVQIEGLSNARRVYKKEGHIPSELYKEEVQLINRFFELKETLTKLDSKISRAASGYDFLSLRDATEAMAKLDTEAFAQYQKWVEHRSARRLVASELLALQSEYAAFFETVIFSDEIAIMSYFKEVGRLSNGHYRLRFIDKDNRLIKEISFQVVDREMPIQPIMLEFNR